MMALALSSLGGLLSAELMQHKFETPDVIVKIVCLFTDPPTHTHTHFLSLFILFICLGLLCLLVTFTHLSLPMPFLRSSPTLLNAHSAA